MVVLTELPETGPGLMQEIKILLDALAGIWGRHMRAHPVPPLYSSGVRYREELAHGSGIEDWACPWRVIKRGWGDCDDLVAYRVAELLAAGEAASVQVLRKRGTKRFHVRVRRANGAVEDPSIRLGAKLPASGEVL